MGLGGLDQMLAALVQQSAAVRYRLGHHGGVHDDALHAGLLISPAARAASMVTACSTSTPSSPMRWSARVDGQFGLQAGLSAEVLPVRVLQPGAHACKC